MGKIILQDMEFIVRHGVCQHEHEFDQKFKVDIELETDTIEPAGATDDLSLTINYANVFQLIETTMYGEHVKLLETLAYRMGYKILNYYADVKAINVRVCKMNPPIMNFNGTAAVEIKVKRKVGEK